MPMYHVKLVERVRYELDVEARDEDAACEIAISEWCSSDNPTKDFDGYGEGVEATDAWEFVKP